MKILLIANHYAVASGRYMTDAFKRLGHDVRHIGPAHGRSIWGMDVDAKYVWEPDEIFPPYPSQYPMREYWDLVIVMDSDPEMLEYARWFNDPQYKHIHKTRQVIVYGVDNHVRDYRRPWFDHYFLAHRGVSVMDWQKTLTSRYIVPGESVVYGIGDHLDMTHLPCAYDPTLFTPSPIPYAEREFDVAMIGVMYPQRWQLVNGLRNAGLKVLAGTGLIYEDYRDAYHNARISLCVSIAGDVAQRVFETAAMGCLVVSDECADYKLLKPKGIWTCPPGQFVDDIKMLIADPEYAQPFIAQSLAWVRGHEWDNRAQVIVDWVQKRQAGEAFYATAE